MHNMDVSDAYSDRICQNCKYWQTNTQLDGYSQGVVCRLGNGHTNSNDTCTQFMPNSTFDSLQDPNRYQDRFHKLNVFK